MSESLEAENRRLKRAFQDLEQLYLRDYLDEDLWDECSPVYDALMEALEIIEGVTVRIGASKDEAR